MMLTKTSRQLQYAVDTESPADLISVWSSQAVTAGHPGALTSRVCSGRERHDGCKSDDADNGDAIVGCPTAISFCVPEAYRKRLWTGFVDLQ